MKNLILILSVLFSAGCSFNLGSKSKANDLGNVGSGLRALTPEERVADFRQMVDLFKTYYGPYAYKEQRFGMKIDDIAAGLEKQVAQATSEEEAYGYFFQFTAHLHDAHVGLNLGLSNSGILSYSVPLGLTPVEGRVLVASVGSDMGGSNVSVGDEVLTFDGVKPLDYLPTILKYRSFATDESNPHFIAFLTRRPSYMTDLKPNRETAQLKLQRATGETYQIEIPWSSNPYSQLDTLMFKSPTPLFQERCRAS